MTRMRSRGLDTGMGSRGGDGSLNSGRATKTRMQFPIKSLANLSEEERSRLAMECFLCRSPYSEPKIFCCTRLCKKCLQSHIDIAELNDEVACLVCKANVKIPDKSDPKEMWADQFKTDNFLTRLQDIQEQLKDKHTCYVCETSKNKKKPANTYCFDCDHYFCEPCNDMHLQLRGMTNHSTSTTDCIEARDIMARRRVFCETHRDRHLEKYCVTCKVLVCQECVDVYHSNKKCHTVNAQEMAAEKRRIVEGLKEEFDSAIRKAEEEDEIIRNRGSRMQVRISQRKEDIEAAFARIEHALVEKKKRLLAELADDGVQDGLGNHSKMGQLQVLITALKDNGAIAEEMIGCGADRDLIESADDLVRQCKTLSEVTNTTARFSFERPTSIARVDKYSVNTFLTLLTALGEDINDQVVAFRTKQIALRMPEDKENPAIKDVKLMGNNVLLAVDNSNKCLKGIAPREGGGHKYLRLDLKTRPWGLAHMQPNVVAMSGHQCLYLVSASEEALTLQSTVRTRKDYWSITALSPINLAAACKFPASIDIVDITGRRLRTIEGETNGAVIFKQPNFLATMNSNILITDREERALICIDQGGEVKWVYKCSAGSKDDKNKSSASSNMPMLLRGVCTDAQNRAYLVDGPNVFMISSEGKQLCQVLTSLPDPRAVTVGKDGLMAVSMDGRGVTFFTLSELKGPYC